jgi:L,D-transpeptidase ErfK/SrfK
MRAGAPRPRAARGLAAWLLLALAGAAAAQERPVLQPVVGSEQKALVVEGDTLLDLAFRHRVGFQALQRLNPGVDPWIPEPGTIVRLPTRMVLPDAPHEGLVVNVPEMRLYDFTVEGDGPEIFAVAVGDAVDPTILGSFRVGRKRRDPAWYVPASIQQEKPELPPVVPPGPGNPLGSRWMTIGETTYGIHGTNNRWSIGREATHGCVRLYEDRMEELFDRVETGTPVRLVYQPLKWGVDGDRLVLEVHPDRYDHLAHPLQAALATPRALGLLHAVDVDAVRRVVEEARGVPAAVGTLPAPRVEAARPGA